MTKNQKSIILGLIAIFIVFVLPVLSINIGGNKTDKVRKIIEKNLYEKYGEEFVVDRIGMRSAAGEKFYQARIYPKSIIGTEKENDKYYYARASLEIKSFGRLAKKAADTYGVIKMNEEAEEYLLPKAKEIFGNRIRLKVDVNYERKTGVWFTTYYVSNFQKRLKEIREMPEERRIQLTLYIYIFDRIDSEEEEEKEKRREEIFEYINYLKKEGLFEYLEMGVIFVDERVLAPSYAEYDRKIFITEDVKEIIDGEIVYLPPKELREEMSRVLGKEIKNLSEEELIESMNKILKENLEPYNTGKLKYNLNYFSLILSLERLKIRGEYTEKKDLERYKYLKKENIKINKYKNYIY
jgi:hypothetical protein